LGFGFRCFLNASLQPGFELFAQQADLAERLKRADLVLTGEGAIDSSTLMGKGVGELATWCRQTGLTCLGFAGTVTVAEKLAQLFARTYSLAPDYVSKEEALSRPAQSLEGLVAQAAAAWK
jgi:glycerate kinase